MKGVCIHIWLIPALPLLSAAVLSVTSRPHRRFAATMTIGTMAISFLLSALAFISTLGRSGADGARHETHNFDWFQMGGETLKLGWVLDPLSAIMLVMVSFVGLLIFVTASVTWPVTKISTHFFLFSIVVFAAAMLWLVIANSLLLLFICWELVGVASYLLIGFWYQKPSAAAAAKKAIHHLSHW